MECDDLRCEGVANRTDPDNHASEFTSKMRNRIVHVEDAEGTPNQGMDDQFLSALQP